MYVFELFDANRKMTKSGVMQKGEKFYYGDDDAFYVIRLAEYPHTTIKSGSLNRKKKKRIDPNFARYRCQLNDVVEIFIETSEELEHRYDHTIDLYSDDSYDPLKLPAVNGVNTIKSGVNEFKFQAKNETFEDVLHAIAYNKVQESLIEKILTRQPLAGETHHESLVKYAATSSLTQEEHIEIFYMIRQLEERLNNRIHINTNTKWHVIDGVKQAIEAAGEIDVAVFYRIEEGNRIHLKTDNLSTGNIFLNPGVAYLIEGYKEGRYVSSRFTSVMPESLRPILWQEYMTKEAKRSHNMNKLKLSGISYNDEREAEIFRVKKNVFNHSFAVIEPEVETMDENEILFSIKDHKLLEVLDRPYYLVIAKGPDALTSRRSLRKRIRGEFVQVELYNDGFHATQDCFAWIESEDGDRISDFSLVPELLTDDQYLQSYIELEREAVEAGMLQQLKLYDEKNLAINGKDVITEVMNEQFSYTKILAKEATKKILTMGLQDSMWHSVRGLFSMYRTVNLRLEHPFIYDSKNKVIHSQENRRDIVFVTMTYDLIEREIFTQFEHSHSVAINPNNITLFYVMDRQNHTCSNIGMISRDKIYAQEDVKIERE